MAMCAVVRQTYWVIMNKQVEIRVSGIEIIFRLESHSLTPVFNLIYLYRHRRQFFRIRKYMRSYYDHLTRAQKSHFYWIYWKVVIAQFATVANISSSTLDMVSIVYSTIWYLYPMLQYYLYLHILHRSLHNSCAQLHAKGMMCSVVDFVFFPYLYIYASSYFLRLIDDSYTDNVMALVTACCVFMKLATIFPLFHACETLYQQKHKIKDRLHELLTITEQESQLHTQVYFLSLRYVHLNNNMSAAGVLDLTYKQLLSILTSAIAFFVLQIQFIIQEH
ncbi:hypothetical protein M8J76_002003 [Diaphorina citri]|nr:hypothetical protein M8J76_002003 [Diaphorina citri]